MKQTKTRTPSLMLAAGLSLAAFQANAEVIQVDFGSQIAPTATGSQDLGSFGAAKADGYATGTYWNVTPNTGNPPALFNDANAATGITITMGSQFHHYRNGRVHGHIRNGLGRDQPDCRYRIRGSSHGDGLQRELPG